MTSKSIKLVAFIVLLVHGIGHFQGVGAGLNLKINNSKPASSWLLKNMGEKTSRYICLILFFLTAIAGIFTAFSFWELLLPHSIWQVLATVTAILSSICLILFPNGFAMFFNKVGAIGVNLLIYYSIVFGQSWPATLFED